MINKKILNYWVYSIINYNYQSTKINIWFSLNRYNSIGATISSKIRLVSGVWTILLREITGEASIESWLLTKFKLISSVL